MRRRMKFAKVLLPLAAVLALAACKKPPEKVSEQDQARAVRVVRVEPRSIVGALSASGDLLPREEAAVMPEVTGYRVSRVLADVGDLTPPSSRPRSPRPRPRPRRPTIRPSAWLTSMARAC